MDCESATASPSGKIANYIQLVEGHNAASMKHLKRCTTKLANIFSFKDTLTESLHTTPYYPDINMEIQIAMHFKRIMNLTPAPKTERKICCSLEYHTPVSND